MKSEPTKGEKKILLQFERFIETKFFHEEVKRIRKISGLPDNGIEPTKKDIENLGSIHISHTVYSTDHPSSFSLKIIDAELKKLEEVLPINNYYLNLLVRYYVIYNRFFYDELKDFQFDFHQSNVCQITDAESEFNEYAPSDDPDTFMSVRQSIEMFEYKLWKYPVSVRIHADASQRDVMEFIKKHWTEIKSCQEKYSKKRKASFRNSKSKINEKIKERNEFIYQHRHLPSAKIMSLLGEKGIWIDTGHILKIISLERKRREKK